MITSKVSFLEADANGMKRVKKNTKYFYGLECAKYNAKTCKTLISDSGETVSNGKKILQMQQEYYSNLYKADDYVSFAPPETKPYYLPDENRPENTEQQFTITEITKAARDLNNGKCPGSDGIPIEVYKCFWENTVYTTL